MCRNLCEIRLGSGYAQRTESGILLSDTEIAENLVQ